MWICRHWYSRPAQPLPLGPTRAAAAVVRESAEHFRSALSHVGCGDISFGDRFPAGSRQALVFQFRLQAATSPRRVRLAWAADSRAAPIPLEVDLREYGRGLRKYRGSAGCG